jgi:hypothetical protein
MTRRDDGKCQVETNSFINIYTSPAYTQNIVLSWCLIAPKFRPFRTLIRALEMAARKSGGIFRCYRCGLTCHFDYFGQRPPFQKTIVWVL